jgi:hypothetical protein
VLKYYNSGCLARMLAGAYVQDGSRITIGGVQLEC